MGLFSKSPLLLILRLTFLELYCNFYWSICISEIIVNSEKKCSFFVRAYSTLVSRPFAFDRNRIIFGHHQMKMTKVYFGQIQPKGQSYNNRKTALRFRHFRHIFCRKAYFYRSFFLMEIMRSNLA